jgi:pimeloyl-ACP methyl ester carboxylesterase
MGSAGRRDRSCRLWWRWRAAFASSPWTYRDSDSDKPLAAAYDARYFAAVIVDLLDALDIDREHLIGNSLGGRVALEVGMRHPDRVGRLALLAPSLASKRQRMLAPLLRIVRPELGLIQFTPRSVVGTIVHRLIPGADNGWAAAGVDECLRAFNTPAGRSAFYAAARHIYLEAPDGSNGFWPRLGDLQADALFIWDAVTGSCRSPSRISPRRCRLPAISSSTAGTSRRSSGRARRTRRSARSSGHERAVDAEHAHHSERRQPVGAVRST